MRRSQATKSFARRLSGHPVPAPALLHLAEQGGAIGRTADQPLAPQMSPEPHIRPVRGGVLADCSHRGLAAPPHFGLWLVRIEKGAAIGGLVVNGTAPGEIPMTDAVLPPGRHQGRVRLIYQGPQVLLGPGEEVLARRAEAGEVGGVEGAGQMTAVDLAERTAAFSAVEAVLFTDYRELVRHVVEVERPLSPGNPFRVAPASLTHFIPTNYNAKQTLTSRTGNSGNAPGGVGTAWVPS